MMKKGKFRQWFILAGIFALLSLGCKSTKPVTDAGLDGNLSVRNIIRNHYKNELQFETLRGRIRIDYNDGRSIQSLGVSFRMQRNKAIWISAPLGVVKAYITPERVSFYNKLEQEYFDGDFVYLSRIVGTELDFQKVQNILFGQALFDLRAGDYQALLDEQFYKLQPKRHRTSLKPCSRSSPGILSWLPNKFHSLGKSGYYRYVI